MAKNILIVLGSPRKKGNSATLAAQVSRGAQDHGAVVETIYLNGRNIRACQGCRACQKPGAAGCCIDDDMQALYPALRRADAIVLASPVYWFNFSAQTKLFMDRWFAVGIGETNIFAGKQLALLLSYADPDAFSSGAVNALRIFQDSCRYLGAEIAGMLYGQAQKAGEIANNEELVNAAYELGCRLAG